ncbi:short transient receptor potential channel 7-like isoform X2 [Littorina saxatilis]|uniref:short transient receptor potential channel 7-like isoform X2 n=1 Tax=Littorina saxatilis TaxID=31220 RepID=UPI0038B5DA9A
MLFSVDQSAAPNSARTPEELAFLHAVEFSDIATARRLMAEDPMLNVDVIDNLGRTALRLAVRNENRELIEMLLEHCNSQNIQQAVLQAISEDHTSIAELMLKHPCFIEICRKRKRLGDTDGFFKTEVESQFSTDMTPLNLAAQKNNYAIVQLLLQRGETIQNPHKFSCGCMECRNRTKFDQLRMANFRLNAYRGLASEAYISLSSEDPFLTGFHLAKELRRLSDDEKHFKKQYQDLAIQVSNYMVKLLDRVWTQQELNYILNKKGQPDMERYENLARLKLALENKERKFVAHPSVQQHLVKIWHSDLNNLETHGWHVRLPMLAFLSVIYPFIVLAYFVKPKSKWTSMAKQPMVKFLGHTVSFLIFLLLLIISSIESGKRVSNKITLGTRYDHIATHYKAYRQELGRGEVPYGEDFPLRPHDPTITEYLITIWVAGMLIQEAQQIFKSGAKAHFNDLYNAVDFCLLVGYIGALVLSFWTMHLSKGAIQELEGKNVTMMLADRKQTDLHIYWLNTDRMHWEKLDPINLAESLFAMANIVSFSRIVNVMPANEALGPMQISLGRMVGDFVKFFVFTALAVGAFIVSLRNLYWWYSNKADPTDPTREDASTSFSDFLSTFRTVFWWIYGRGAWEHALDVPAKYAKTDVADVTMEVGMILAGLYHLTIIIVLVNLLIAMMARSFEKIVDDVDVEWKFARSVLYMEYIGEGVVPPVPFNVFTPFRDVISAVAKRLRECCRDVDEEVMPRPAVSNLRRPALIDLSAFTDSPKIGMALNGKSHSAHTLRSTMTANSSEEKPTYMDIAQTIVQRYIFDIQREEENSTDNLEEARQNLFNTKWDLLEIMDKRDNTVCHLTACLKASKAELSLLDQLPNLGTDVVKRRRWSGSSLGLSRIRSVWSVGKKI